MIKWKPITRDDVERTVEVALFDYDWHWLLLGHVRSPWSMEPSGSKKITYRVNDRHTMNLMGFIESPVYAKIIAKLPEIYSLLLAFARNKNDLVIETLVNMLLLHGKMDLYELEMYDWIEFGPKYFRFDIQDSCGTVGTYYFNREKALESYWSLMLILNGPHLIELVNRVVLDYKEFEHNIRETVLDELAKMFKLAPRSEDEIKFYFGGIVGKWVSLKSMVNVE